MDKMNAQTEKQVANMLLERGVKVQIKAPLFFRIFGKKKRELVLKEPKLSTLVAICVESLDFDFNLEKDYNLKEAAEVVAVDGKRMARLLALGIFGEISNGRLNRLSKRLLADLSAKQLFYLYQLIMVHGGVQDFMNTIRYTLETRITKPMNLSQEPKRS